MKNNEIHRILDKRTPLIEGWSCEQSEGRGGGGGGGGGGDYMLDSQHVFLGSVKVAWSVKPLVKQQAHNRVAATDGRSGKAPCGGLPSREIPGHQGPRCCSAIHSGGWSRVREQISGSAKGFSNIFAMTRTHEDGFNSWER